MTILMDWKKDENTRNYQRNIIFEALLENTNPTISYIQSEYNCYTLFYIKLKEVLYLYKKNGTERILQSFPEIKEKHS